METGPQDGPEAVWTADLCLLTVEQHRNDTGPTATSSYRLRSPQPWANWSSKHLRHLLVGFIVERVKCSPLVGVKLSDQKLYLSAWLLLEAFINQSSVNKRVPKSGSNFHGRPSCSLAKVRNQMLWKCHDPCRKIDVNCRSPWFTFWAPILRPIQPPVDGSYVNFNILPFYEGGVMPPAPLKKLELFRAEICRFPRRKCSNAWFSMAGRFEIDFKCPERNWCPFWVILTFWSRMNWIEENKSGSKHLNTTSMT